jgi:hypothetical protein
VTRAARSTRWGAAFGALVAGVLVVVVAASAAGADGRRGTIIFGIAGVMFLIAGLVVSSGVYPAALVGLAVSFSFSLTGHHVASAAVIATSGLLFVVDQLTAWSFDAATGAIERGRDSAARVARTVAVVVIGAGVTALVLSAGNLPVPGGLAAEAIGIAAALGVLGLAASRRWER